jgi:hypothetical protein
MEFTLGLLSMELTWFILTTLRASSNSGQQAKCFVSPFKTIGFDSPKAIKPFGSGRNSCGQKTETAEGTVSYPPPV